eukprot:GSMAST32.ASY1.ANO1.1009.1 assembled CDS
MLNVFKEVELWEKLDHENVVKLYECFFDGGKIYLVTELMRGGELFDNIISRQSYCHSKNIIHRDIKPANILLSDTSEHPTVKIADFGFATTLKAERSLSLTFGTPGYVAPEILVGRGYSEAVDMWSFGVIVYVLLCGYPPFYDDDHEEMLRMVRTASYKFPDLEWDNISDAAKDLIMKLLTRDEEARLTAKQVMKHPWMIQDIPEKEISVPSRLSSCTFSL